MLTIIRRTVLAWLLLAVSVTALAQVSLSGRVYVDGNNNAQFDSGEVVPPGVMYLKLVQAGAVKTVVSLSNGTYSFSNVVAGSYALVLSTNNLTSDTTAIAPSGYHFRSPVSGTLSVTVAASSQTGLNFGVVSDGQCVCGFQDGRYTQTSVTLDGNMSDWTAVMADPDNSSCDPLGAADADYPIQSTGRDLTRVVTTYDNTWVSVFTQRAGSTSNTNNFIYYHDTNNNGRMESGEKVVTVAWQGSNRSISVQVGDYFTNTPNGDPIASPTTNKIDGYTLPGQVVNLRTMYGGTWGSADGTMMEWSVRWTDLNATPGTPVKFHTSSTNSTPGAGSFPGQVDDNVGGCGTCFVSNQYAAVAIVAAQTQPAAVGSTVYFYHTVTNQGNGNDVLNLKSTTSGGFTPSAIRYYKDNGIVGKYEPGIDTLLTDSNGDSTVDTGTMVTNQSIAIVAAVDIPSSATGTATVVTTATSTFVPGCAPSGYPFPSASVTDTITSAVSISGYAYFDYNQNGTRDFGDNGTGLTLYAKLVPTATPSGPATAVVTVDASTGYYAFLNPSGGNYNVIVSTDGTAANVSALVPSGWVRTQPSTGIRSITLGGSSLTDVNFGLYNNSTVQGTVFLDNGAGSGTANDGIKNGGELALADVIVKLTDTTGNVLTQTLTDASGRFALVLPPGTTQARIVEQLPSGFIATGASIGTTGGTYSLANNWITFNYTTGSSFTGVAFGNVGANQFYPDNSGTGQAGSFVTYAHVFAASTAGTLALNEVSANAWSFAVYRDLNCNGSIDPADSVVSGTIPVTVAGNVCVVLREALPADAKQFAQDVVTLTATFTFANNASIVQTFTRTDVTSVSSTGTGLQLLKSVDKTSAVPGDVLTYTIKYSNSSTTAIASLVINDAAPAFTTLQNATCVTPLPLSLTGCNVTLASGYVQWTMSGNLDPGQFGIVTFQVKVAQ